MNILNIDMSNNKLIALAALIVAIGTIITFSYNIFVWAHGDIYQHIEQYEKDWSDELEARRARNFCRANPELC